jgi:hypothetical protein
MARIRLAKNALIPFLFVAILLAPGTASAGGLKNPGKNGSDPWAGYPAPITTAYSLPGVNIDPTYSACCYTVPIVAVYQCPAGLTGQRGSQVVYIRSNPAFGLLGGQPYLYHH